MVSEAQWQQFQEEGYLHLGKVMDNGELEAIQQRIDDIMLGKAPLDYDLMLMQLDYKSETDSTPGPQTKGHKGATLNYRKIQDLEFDSLFLTYMQTPLFRDICAKAYGPDTPIACFRAMFMNKPARKGNHLPWHQDRWTDLDRDPLITIWDGPRSGNRCQRLRPDYPPIPPVGSHQSGKPIRLSQPGTDQRPYSQVKARLRRAAGGRSRPAAQLAAPQLRGKSDRHSPACIQYLLYGCCYKIQKRENLFGYFWRRRSASGGGLSGKSPALPVSPPEYLPFTTVVSPALPSTPRPVKSTPG